MSAPVPKAYRFRTGEQWRTCLSHGLDVDPDGGASQRPPLGRRARDAEIAGRISGVALDPFRQPLWRTAAGLGRYDDLGAPAKPLAVDEVIARSPRLVADGRWLWAFGPRDVCRYDAETLELDEVFELDAVGDPEVPAPSDPASILDIAGDGREGVWALVEARDDGRGLVHFDRRGCPVSHLRLRRDAASVSQIAAVERGRVLLLLGGGCLWRVRAADGAGEWARRIADYVPGWTVERMASDGRTRVALGGPDEQGVWTLCLLDAAGDLLQEPLDDLFDGTEAPTVLDLAIGDGVVLLATDDGLRRLDASEACAAGGAVAVVVTPALLSPITSTGRGWLRAELDIDLPAGAAVSASFASTDDPIVAERAKALAANGDLPAATRQELIWSALDGEGTAGGPYVVSGDGKTKGLLAIPLFSTDDRWLWLRLELHTPAGVDAPRLRELRVLYPEVSLMQQLPAAFRGPKNDPTGALRRIVGVLETTTQDIDQSIRDIGRRLDAERTGGPWLDYMARWLGVPWDRALPEAAKRRVLRGAGEILKGRGAREGLLQLLACLVSPGEARVVDVTADYETVRLGGGGCPGAPLPALLAGVPRRSPTVGEKAVLGRARLVAPGAPRDPLASIAPTLRIELTAPADVRDQIAPLLPDLLADYVPVGLRTVIVWRLRPDGFDADEDGFVLDGDGPGVIGKDSFIGRTVLAGRMGGPIGDQGLEMDFRLR